jgi:hypothetical protein
LETKAQGYLDVDNKQLNFIKSGDVDTQYFTLSYYKLKNLKIHDYGFRSGCGCVSIRLDSLKSKAQNQPIVEFIYNSSGNEGRIHRYGVVYLHQEYGKVDSIKLGISVSVIETSMSKKDLVNSIDTAIYFEYTTYSFDTLVEGEHGQAIFTFYNRGPIPVVIERVSSSCGCVVPNYSKEPIMPGGKGEVRVYFNSNGKIGINTKSVDVIFNIQRVVLSIRAEVVPRPSKPEVTPEIKNTDR